MLCHYRSSRKPIEIKWNEHQFRIKLKEPTKLIYMFIFIANETNRIELTHTAKQKLYFKKEITVVFFSYVVGFGKHSNCIWTKRVNSKSDQQKKKKQKNLFSGQNHSVHNSLVVYCLIFIWFYWMRKVQWHNWVKKRRKN